MGRSDFDGGPLEGVGLGQDEDRKEWSPKDGLVALAVALAASFSAALMIFMLLSIVGVSNPGDSAGFAFSATLVQEIAFVAGAVLVALESGRISAAQFGFRSFKLSAFAWLALAIFVFMVIAFLYDVAVNPPQDELPRSFGADRSVGLAVATGVLVVAVAPLVEEFFFRGFLFTALKNGIGVWPAALVSGALFGAIHFKPVFFVPLFALGVILALLYHRTGSLWPCIAFHAANNALAFAISI